MAKIINKFSILLLISLLLFCFTACDSPSIQPPEEKKVTEGSLIIEPSTEKELVWAANTAVSEYVYKATPLFSGTATGTATEWQHLSFTGSGKIGQLTQGKWQFELQGRNNKGTAITTGHGEIYVEAGKENILSINMKTDPTLGLGTVQYSVWMQNVSLDGSILKVYDRPAGEKSYSLVNTHQDITTANPHIVSTVTGFSAGYHEIIFMLFDANGTLLGGEQLGIQVVANETTTISGVIEPSMEQEFELNIKSMGYVHAELFPSDGIEVEGTGRDKTAYIERGDVVSFTWKDQTDATSHPTEWIWALDGEVIENSGKSYSLSYTEYGEHELSVVGIRRDSDGVAWDCGSAVIRIVVMRHVCEITFMADGGFFPDGTDIMVMYEDTTLETDRKIPGGNPFDGLSPQKTGYRLAYWIDAETNVEVVRIAEDGTVTFLPAFVTKEETRKLKAVWVAGTYNVTVIWSENVKVNNKSVEYSTSHTIKSGESLSSFLVSAPERQGFEFINYSTEENGRGDIVQYNDTFRWGKDITIYANWEYIPINVSYYKNYSDYEDGKPGYKVRVVGSDLRYGSLPQPLRQGKVFKGWAQPEDLDPTKYEEVDGLKYIWQDGLLDGKSYVQVTTYVRKYYDHELIAVWGEGDIKITFDTGDGTLTDKGNSSLAEFDKDSTGAYYKLGALGTQYGALPFTGIETEVRDGMEFMGWYDSAAYNVRVYEVSAVTTNADHTLYAKWEGAKLKVSFDPDNGTSLDTKEVRYLGTYGTLPEVIKTGYEFGGWTYNGEVITEDSTVHETTSHTLKAKWIPKKSSLTLETAGGTYSGSTSLTVDYDAKYSTASNGSETFASSSTTSGLKEPTRVGYDFAGWYTNPAGVGTAVTGDTINKIDTAQTLYATWTAHKHTITFYNNWPSVDETKGKAATSTKSDIPFGTSYGDLPQLSVTGYTFNGWFTAASGGVRVSETTKYDVDKDISLYARWSITVINISFYEDGIVCKDSSGASLSPVSREYGSKYGPLPTPYKFGYTFTGKWKIVGKTDSAGNPIYLTDSDIVSYVDDITLSPTWTPDDVLVIAVKEITAGSTGNITSIDWTDAATYQVTFGEKYESGKSATVSGGKWTAGSAKSLPTYSKTGYTQDEWLVVVNGKSTTRTSSTAYLLDYAGMDTLGVKQYGAVTPDRVVYIAPNWQAKTYTITYKNYLQDSSGKYNETTEAPIKQSVLVEYDQKLSSVLGTDTSSWVYNWDNHACVGIYTDSAMTKKAVASSVVGTDIMPDKDGNIVLYCKWNAVRTRIEIDTTKSNYVDTRNEMLKVSEILSGSSNGLFSGSDGWYDFSGTVNERTYKKLRKGKSDLTVIYIAEKGSGSWTVPANMTIKIPQKTASRYQVTERCSVCNGAGYKELKSSTGYVVNEAHGTSTGTGSHESSYGHGTVSSTASIYYRANTMYDFCPDGCKDWIHINSSNAEKTYGRWVVCPNCNGQYASKRSSGWSSYVVYDYCNGHAVYTTEYYCPGHDVIVGSVVKTCPGHKEVDKEWEDSEGNQQFSYKTTYCSGCVETTEETLETWYHPSGRECKSTEVFDHYDYCDGCCASQYVYWYDNRCYCEYQSEAVGGVYNPGYIWLSGYRVNCYENGGITVKNNGSEVSGSFSASEGNTITASLIPVTRSNSNMLIDLLNTGYIQVTDSQSDFNDEVGDYNTGISLANAGDGSILVHMGYNHYDYLNSRYAVSNGNTKTSKTTPYYSYEGLIHKIGYSDITGTNKISDTKSELGMATSNEIDSSLGQTFEIVQADGTKITGTVTQVAWSNEFISIQYDGKEFIWYYRPDKTNVTLPVVKSLKLYCWLKTE